MSFISINFKGKNFKILQETVHIRFKDIEMKTLNLQKKKIDSMSNLIGFENIPDLEALILDKNRITEIDEIPNLKNLKYLSLKNNNIHSIKSLEGLPSLIELNLAGNEISTISGLGNLPNLQVLHLEDNKITEINNLEHLKYLEYLYLDNNQINEIVNLEKLNRLTLLSLSNNQIAEVKNLDKNHALRKIDVRNNQITKINPINLKYLDEFELSGNPYYKYLKSRYAIVDAEKIIEHSINPEGLEKRWGVGKKNIYVPLDYSTLRRIIPRNDKILYSTLCNASTNVIVPAANIQRSSKRIRWKAHVILTESGCAISEPKGKYVGTKFLKWNALHKVKLKMSNSVSLRKGTGLFYAITLSVTRAEDFESSESFINRRDEFSKLCVSLWEQYGNNNIPKVDL